MEETLEMLFGDDIRKSPTHAPSILSQQQVTALATLAETLQTAVDKLGERSDSPRLDAEILLCLATGKTRAHLRAWPERQLDEGEAHRFEVLLRQRIEGRPIAHITGNREFWSREFVVTPDVLIPRPETELLVERVLDLIPSEKACRVLDLGTGSGVLAVTLALELPNSSVTALDISPAALAIARGNAEALSANNVRFMQSDWFSALASAERFDLIVSNPPYIAEADPHLGQGDVRFEPKLALASGPEGLDAIRRIVGEAPEWLRSGGWLLFEHGYDQGEAARTLLISQGFEAVSSFRDLPGHERVSGGRRR